MDEKTVILDLGSGNGKTITKFAAVLNSTAVGIECDKLRHECSMVNLSTIMQHIDVNVVFVHGDIDLYFQTFNGYGIIYMFDTAYPPKTIDKIRKLFHTSSSIKAIVCNSVLDQLDFNVTLSKSLGSLSAGNTYRNFYIYRSNIYCNNFVLDELNENDIQSARSTKRMELVNNVSTAFLSKSRTDKSMIQTNSIELYHLLQKQPTTINDTIFLKADQAVGVTDKKSCYTVYNRQDLLLTNKFEYRAVVWEGKYLGVITPSYDGSGEILIRIIYYTIGPTYEAIIYNIRNAMFRKISVKSLFSNLSFDHKIPIPSTVNMIDLMAQYRKDYPINEVFPVTESVDNTIGSRKRKANEVFSPKVVMRERTSNASSKSSSLKNSNNNLVQIQEKLVQLEEENKLLNRKASEIEKDSQK